jgi:hypothetical protein
VLSKFIKTAKYMADWLDWALIYPLWHTKSGREQIITILLPYIKNNPTKVWEMRQMAVKAMGEMYMNKLFAGFGYPEPGSDDAEEFMGIGSRRAPKPAMPMPTNGVDATMPMMPENPMPMEHERTAGQAGWSVHNFAGKMSTPWREMFDLKRRFGIKKS